MQKIYILFVGLLIFTNPVFSQTSISGVINQYAAVTGIDTDCKSLLMVSDTTGFRKGEEILLIQMQGAEVIIDNVASFGDLNSLEGAGDSEKVMIDSVALGEIYLKNQLLNSYAIDGAIQIISIPIYEDAVVVDTLRPQPWNGQTGGVLILEVRDSLILEAPVLATGLGFRGGASSLNLPNDCQWFIVNNDYYYDSNSWRGAAKGEGIAKPVNGREFGKGSLINGGGGGNDHNAGGGGGAHFFSGGRGGENDEPSTFGCKGRHPGEGGWLIPRSLTLDGIFMGGGGGAGHANNNNDSHGGHGGGAIIIDANVIFSSNNQLIEANGNAAPDTRGDGAGGGGAGGSVTVIANEVSSNITILANGGNGGSVSNASDRCMGPGGGGSGGSIYYNITSMASYSQPQGGLSGRSLLGTCGSNNNNGAMDGRDGFPMPFDFDSIPQSNTPITGGFAFVAQPQAQRVCLGDLAQFQVEVQGANLSYQWQVNMGSGFQSLSNDAIYSGTQTAQLTVSNINNGLQGNLYRCLVSSDCNSGAPSFEVLLSIVAEPEITDLPQNQSICEGDNTSFSLQAMGTGLTYQWQCDNGSGFVDVVDNMVYSGATTATLSLSQAMTDAAYRCLLRDSCGIELSSASALLQVASGPTANFNFNVNSGDVSFTDLSTNATSWLWDFGDSQTSNLPAPNHTYTNEDTYTVTLTVTNACGTSVFTQTIQIILEVAPQAMLNLDRREGCLPLTVQFTDASFGNVENRLWTFEGGDPATSTDANPQVIYRDAGSFDVTLEVSNSAGNSLILEEDFILTVEPPRADFDYMENGLIFSFQNLSTNATSFQWNFGDGSPVVTEENPTHEYAGNGAYTVTLIASNPSCASALSIPVDINIVSIDQFLSNHQIRMYPNPVDDHLTIERSQPGEEFELKIFSAEGRLLYQEQLPASLYHQINWSAFPSGLYFVELREGAERAVGKVVKVVKR